MRRGQAVAELALSSLVLVSLITAGIYFGEVTFGALKVTEAAQSGIWDMTHYKTHSMAGILYSTNSEVTAAAGAAQGFSQNAYQDFDGRTSVTKATTLTHVMTRATNMQVTCQRGSPVTFNPNPLTILSYNDNNGASCNASATFASTTAIRKEFLNDPQGFFKARYFERASMTACAAGKNLGGGGCRGRFSIMLDDWGLTGPSNGPSDEWNPCPGIPFGFGIPCPNNLQYWWTAFKGYFTSYVLNAVFKPVMFTMPASLLSQWVAFANPMGGSAGLIAFPGSGNESTFYLSFTGSLSLYQQPLWVREGFFLWETTPFAMSALVPYSIAHFQRMANGGCYLGKRCN